MSIKETGVSYYGLSYVEHARRDFQEMIDHNCTAVLLALSEFDLAEWLVGAPITGVYAAINGDRAANVILRLSNDVVCSVETGVTLPPGSPMHDRHELIARRGVASDRAVDTQVAQSSISAWTDSGTQQYTDTDAELFGLSQDQISLARSAYEALRSPECVSKLRAKHVRLRQLVELAYESDRLRQRMTLEGVCV